MAVSTYVRASTRGKEGMECTRIESREEGGARRRLVRKQHFLTSIAAGTQPVPWSTPGFECPRSSPPLALSPLSCYTRITVRRVITPVYSTLYRRFGGGRARIQPAPRHLHPR